MSVTGMPYQHRTWRKVREEGCCRICGGVGANHPPPKSGWVTGHHLIPRNSIGSTNSDDNIVPLCFRCHKIVDSHKPANIVQREELRRILRANLRPEEIAYCNLMMGRGWIDRHYPLDGRR